MLELPGVFLWSIIIDMFSRKQVFRTLLVVVFIILMVYANFYIVRRVTYYALEVYLYDRLLIAYEVGSSEKMKEQLSMIASNADMPRERALAKKFEKNISSIKDIHGFLKKAVKEDKSKIKLLKNMRAVSIVLILILFIARSFMIAREWFALRSKQ